MLKVALDDLPTLKETVLRGWELGLREGKEEGREEGLLEGEARVLERLLVRRFGPLPEWARVRLQAADLATLERYAGAVLTADRLEAVFGGRGRVGWTSAAKSTTNNASGKRS